VVVVPCFNEAERLEVTTFASWIKAAQGVELLFVNDGSQDATEERLDEIRSASPDRVRILSLKTNQGKAEAVRLGMREALASDPSFVAFWDADLSTRLEEISRFLDVFSSVPGVQIVMGSRVKLLGRHIQRQGWRHYSGRFFATIVSNLLHLPVYDTQCGAKMFRANKMIRDVTDAPFETRWLFDVEILARCIELHPEGLSGIQKSVYELPLDSWEDKQTTSLTIGPYIGAALSVVKIFFAHGAALRRAARVAANGAPPPTA